MDDTSRGPIPSSSTAPPPPETVRHNLACIDCGHNLLGAPIESNCGECGIPVAWTAKGTTLAYAPRRFLARLHLGVRMLIVCLAVLGAITATLLLLSVTSVGMSADLDLLMALVSVLMAVAVVGLLGIWFISTATLHSWSILRPPPLHGIPAGLMIDDPSSAGNEPSDGRIVAPISRPLIRYALLAMLILSGVRMATERLLKPVPFTPTVSPAFSSLTSSVPGAAASRPFATSSATNSAPLTAPAPSAARPIALPTPPVPAISPTDIVLRVFYTQTTVVLSASLCFYLAWLAARLPSIRLFIFARWIAIIACTLQFCLGLNPIVQGPVWLNQFGFLPTFLPILVLIPLSLHLRTIRIARSAEVRSIRRGLAYPTAPAPHSLPYS